MPNQMERFTQRARRTLSFAQEEAERKRHTYIGPEHLLVGLMREEGGIGARVLHDLGLDSRRIDEEVTKVTPVGLRVSDARLDLSSDTKKVLELAVDEARRLGHHYIGTEHLLLGLARQSEGIAIEIFNRLNVTPEDIRRQTRRVLQEQPPQMMPPAPQVRARTASSRPSDPGEWLIWLTLAYAEAKRLEINYVGTPHLLIALMAHQRCSETLHSLGIEKDKVVGALKDLPAELLSAQNMEFSPQLITSLGLAVEEIYRSEKAYLRVEYLLLALVRNKQSMVAQIMEKLGVSLEDVEKAVRDLLAEE